MRKSSMWFFSVVSFKSTPNCVILKQIFGCNSSGDIPKNPMPHWSLRNFPWSRVGIFIIDMTTNCDETMRTSECMIPNLRRHRLSVSDTTSGITKNSYSSRLPNDIFEPKRRSKQQQRDKNGKDKQNNGINNQNNGLNNKNSQNNENSHSNNKRLNDNDTKSKSTNSIEKTTTLHRKIPQKKLNKDHGIEIKIMSHWLENGLIKGESRQEKKVRPILYHSRTQIVYLHWHSGNENRK